MITIKETTENQLTIQKYLIKNGFNFINHDNIDAVGEKATKDQLNFILKTICDHRNVSFSIAKSKYRGTGVVYVKKLYCYIAKSMFPFTSDAELCAVLNIDRSTLTTHKLELSTRLSSKIKDLPENKILKFDIDTITNIISDGVQSILLQDKPLTSK